MQLKYYSSFERSDGIRKTLGAIFKGENKSFSCKMEKFTQDSKFQIQNSSIFICLFIENQYQIGQLFNWKAIIILGKEKPKRRMNKILLLIFHVCDLLNQYWRVWLQSTSKIQNTKPLYKLWDHIRLLLFHTHVCIREFNVESIHSYNVTACDMPWRIIIWLITLIFFQCRLSTLLMLLIIIHMRADEIILQSKNGKRNDEWINECTIILFFLPLFPSFIPSFLIECRKKNGYAQKLFLI